MERNDDKYYNPKELTKMEKRMIIILARRLGKVLFMNSLKEKENRNDEKSEFYSIKNILSYEAIYRIIYGERSNGKTTAVLRLGIERFWESKCENQLAIIRRWDEDFKSKKASSMFDGIVKLGWIKDITKGEYNSVYHNSRQWFLCYYDENGDRIKTMEKPFCLGFALTSEEHYKGNSYPSVYTILFDEFITRKYYLPEEFITFSNLLSTIIRKRDGVEIFMCGNTINKYDCPYFAEMGLYNIKKQKIGTIEVYSFGENAPTVAVEYSDSPSNKKVVNKYFAFDNPKLKMITEGAWEIDIYPHLPIKYKPKNNKYIFYVSFDGELLQGNVIIIEHSMFLYFHRKTTEIKEDNTRIVYSLKPNYKPNYRISFLSPQTKVDKKVLELYMQKRVFYQDNEVGEIFTNYIKRCRQGNREV